MIDPGSPSDAPAGRALPGNAWDQLDGMTPLEPPRVSVIVAHYDQPRQLARTLRALRGQDHPADRLEVIVADDGSPRPPDLAALPGIPDGTRLVRQEDAGFRLAAVRNLGAAAARGDILVFLDADTAPEPGFVRELTRLPALAPDVVVVGRRRHADLAAAPDAIPLAEAVAGRELPEPAWLADSYRASRNLLDADDRGYRFVIGAVLACSRRLFDEAGGFDESFTRYGGEDWEWAYRAWIRGALLAHVPTAVAWHDGPDAGGREADPAAKNAEAIRLADLIPVPGSRGHGMRPSRLDVVVRGPEPGATAGQAFVSRDSVLAALPGAELAPVEPDPAQPAPVQCDLTDRDRADRIRVVVDILRPVRVRGAGLAESVDRLAAEQLGRLTLTDAHGVELIRLESQRAAHRHRRWGRDDLFPAERVALDDIEALDGEPDIEGYLGGWA